MWLLFCSGPQSNVEVHPHLSPIVTSGSLGQFQLVFQAEDVIDVVEGALDQQVGVRLLVQFWLDIS